MTGVGIVVYVLAFLAKYFQLDVDNGQLTELVQVGAQFLGAVWVIWGQTRRKDLKVGLKRVE